MRDASMPTTAPMNKSMGNSSPREDALVQQLSWRRTAVTMENLILTQGIKSAGIPPILGEHANETTYKSRERSNISTSYPPHCVFNYTTYPSSPP
jgi:hypothetical protein